MAAKAYEFVFSKRPERLSALKTAFATLERRRTAEGREGEFADKGSGHSA